MTRWYAISHRSGSPAPLRRSWVAAVLVALILGQMALQVHRAGHGLSPDDPVCEMCVVAHSAALAGTGSASVPAALPAEGVDFRPFAILPVAPRVAAARDPPAFLLS